MDKKKKLKLKLAIGMPKKFKEYPSVEDKGPKKFKEYPSVEDKGPKKFKEYPSVEDKGPKKMDTSSKNLKSIKSYGAWDDEIDTWMPKKGKTTRKERIESKSELDNLDKTTIRYNKLLKELNKKTGK